MNLELMMECNNRARAYPVSIVLQYPLTAVRNMQKVPQKSQLCLKKLVRREDWKKNGKMRIGNWNVGSLTGEGRELIDVMQRRKIMILCKQEIKWKGKSARKLGEDIKFITHGKIHPDLQENVTEVQHISDRLMSLKFVKDKRVWHIISAYTPQQRCSEEEKEELREKLEEYIESVPRSELLVLSGDMNAHVGECQFSDGFEAIHGGRNLGRTQEGEILLELAEAMYLVVLNTQFEKKKLSAAAEVCGRTIGKQQQEKEKWLWNQEVQTALKEKSIARSGWEEDNYQTREEYRWTKRETKRVVAITKGEARIEWDEITGTPEGEKIIYRIAEARRIDRQDVGEAGIIKHEIGNIFIEEEEVKRRWRDHFSQLLNNESECEELENVSPVEEPIANIRENDVENAIKKGKVNKAAGKSEVTIEMIKASGNLDREWLHTLLENIWHVEGMPRDWNDSWMIKMYEQKGDVLNFGNYRGIKVLEHVFTVLQRIVEGN
ncbi:uncharacterized protein LOC135204418 [Macrobrachium nipponense]|uniref:uncharacterized protein LOC135204418 n=1 Tax=Macrobrachium nipponense TaxID=159736 RepID=UPI0030C7AA80